MAFGDRRNILWRAFRDQAATALAAPSPPAALVEGQDYVVIPDGKPFAPAKGKIEVRGGDGNPVTAKARDGVATVDQDEIVITALEDSEIVMVETDRLN